MMQFKGMLAGAGWELDINDDSLCYATASRPVLHTVKSAKSSKSFIVYPNPAKDRIFIKMPDREIGKIEIRILDILGNTIFQQYRLTDTGLYEIPILTLPLGAFFIQVFQDGEIIGAKKFFKIP